MTILSIPDATYQRLAEHAAGLHLSVEEFLDRVAAPAVHPPADQDRAFAALSGLVAGLAIQHPPGHALDDSRGATNPDPSSAAGPLAPQEWLRRRAEWKREVEARADRYPPGYAADDSREGINADREAAQR